MGELNYIKAQNLYRIDTYIDDTAGRIEVMVPVLEDGAQDPVRMTQFVGSSTLSISTGQRIELKFKILKALDLATAIDQWGPGLEAAIRELEDQQRRQAIAKPGVVRNGKVLLP